jgi:hypothetical protein
VGGGAFLPLHASSIPLHDPACSFKQVKLIVGSHRVGSKGSGIKITYNGGKNLCEGKELIFYSWQPLCRRLAPQLWRVMTWPLWGVLYEVA